MARCPDTLLVALLVALVGACGEAAEQAVPAADPASIHAFLTSMGYADWESEPDIRPGLNGTGRRVFLSEVTDFDGSAVGAAGVREIYDGWEGAPELIGWSVLIKVDETGDARRDWFFYETFEPGSADRHAVAQRGAPGCMFCHEAAPDVIRSRRPLR